MKTAAAATAALVLLLAGCQGGDNSPQSTPTDGSSVVTTATAPTTEPEGDGGMTTPLVEPNQPPDSLVSQPTPSDAVSSLPPWSDELVQGDPGGESPQDGQEITGVRIATHEDFDRVVLDLSGDEPALGWYAGFQPDAIEDPSGLPFEIEGDAFLNVDISGINWVREAPDRYDGDGVADEGTKVVTEVKFGGLFEGHQQVLIGLKRQTAFRVFALSDPARIVIDVQHP